MGAIVPSDANGRRPIHSADGQNVRVTITAADRERIRRRYPPKRLSAAAVAVLGLVILALIGYVIWVASHKANPPVSGRIDAFSVVSDNELKATLAIDRPDPAQPVKCFLVVQAVSYERVGERWVEIPPGTERVTQVEVSLRTFKRGTAVTVDSCGPS